MLMIMQESKLSTTEKSQEERSTKRRRKTKSQTGRGPRNQSHECEKYAQHSANLSTWMPIQSNSKGIAQWNLPQTGSLPVNFAPQYPVYYAPVYPYNTPPFQTSSNVPILPNMPIQPSLPPTPQQWFPYHKGIHLNSGTTQTRIQSIDEVSYLRQKAELAPLKHKPKPEKPAKSKVHKSNNDNGSTPTTEGDDIIEKLFGPSSSRRIKKRAVRQSKYRGVCWNKSNNSWKSCLKVNGKNVHIGYFDEEIDAAKAYDLKAKALRGDDAKLNFPDGF